MVEDSASTAGIDSVKRGQLFGSRWVKGDVPGHSREPPPWFTNRPAALQSGSPPSDYWLLRATPHPSPPHPKRAILFDLALPPTVAIRAAMTFWQKLCSLAAGTLLLPFLASAQEEASKYHYDGIYKGTIPIDLLINGTDKHRAKAQLIFYPDGRLMVLTVESPQTRNPANIKGKLKKNVFTGEWKKGFFGSDLSFQAVFHGGSAVVSVNGKNKRPEKWYFTKASGG